MSPLPSVSVLAEASCGALARLAEARVANEPRPAKRVRFAVARRQGNGLLAALAQRPQCPCQRLGYRIESLCGSAFGMNILNDVASVMARKTSVLVLFVLCSTQNSAPIAGSTRSAPMPRVAVLVGNCCFRGRRVMSGKLGQVRTRVATCISIVLWIHPRALPGYAIEASPAVAPGSCSAPLAVPFWDCGRESAPVLIDVLSTLAGTNEKERAWTVTRLGYDRPRLARARVRRNRTRRGSSAIARRPIHCEPR